MGSAALAIDARTETYSDLKGMIFGLAHHYSKPFPQERDEAISQAHLAFLESFADFNRSRSQFGTFVNMRIRSKLLEWQRTLMRRRILGNIVDNEMDAYQSSPSFTTRMIDTIDELSEDAKEVLRLTLDSPRDVIHAIYERGDYHNPRFYKAAIIETLKDLGWTAERIFESFTEIREALI